MHRFKFASFLASTLIFAGVARAQLDDGIISYWPLDGNFADVVGGNDGEFMGGGDPEFDDGQFGKGIDLDGIDQFIEIGGDESEFDFLDSNFSISAWFRVDDFTKNWQALIAKGEGNRWRVHRRGGENIMTWNGGNADVPAGPTNVNDGEIHHFVGVSTPDEVLMYIDGELESIGPAPSLQNNDMPVMIGENPDARNRTWDGLVDDVAIWGRALDESEVAVLWNGGEGNKPTEGGPIPPIFIEGPDTIGTRIFRSNQSNNMFGPVEDGVPGWSARIVTADDHGLGQLGNHTIAEDALDEAEGTVGPGAYPVADFGGGGGFFPDTQPYPNGVADTSQSDFAVEATATGTFPAGEYSVAICSDDGGKVIISGVEFDFDNSKDNNALEDDEVRFEGNRGHNCSVASFELEAPLVDAEIIASMHERGGGDSIEVAIIDEIAIENANPNNGWELLRDGVFGINLTTSAAPLISADLTATGRFSREVEFDVNADDGTSDTLSIENDNPDVFTTILDLSGNESLTFQIKATGDVSSGEAFTIIDADTIILPDGGLTINSVIAGQNWVFDVLTGRVCLDSCPPAPGDCDFDGSGTLDVGDVNLLSAAIQAGNDLAFDVNKDGSLNVDDLNAFITGESKLHTWIGDANLDGEFNSSDFVGVFQEGLYETGNAASWTQGDWNADGVFDSGDFVVAFQDGGFELGPRWQEGVASVPEPSSIALLLLGALGLFGARRRK